jgi:hypothetical protein
MHVCSSSSWAGTISRIFGVFCGQPLGAQIRSVRMRHIGAPVLGRAVSMRRSRVVCNLAIVPSICVRNLSRGPCS